MNWNYQRLSGDSTHDKSDLAIIGNLIFLSGFSYWDGVNMDQASPGLKEQVIAILDQMQLSLEQAGSSPENVVKHFILIRSQSDCRAVADVLEEYYRKNVPKLVETPPAITFAIVNAFQEQNCLVEFDIIAVMDRDMPGWETKTVPVEERKGWMPLRSESVSVGNLIFFSGLSADNQATGVVESDSFEEQMDIAFDKLLTALDRTGSSPSNIIKTLHLQTFWDSMASETPGKVSHSPASDRLWKRELEHYEIHAPYLLDDPPGSTFLKLPENSLPKSLVQFDIIGVHNRYMPGWEVRKYPLYYGQRGFPRHLGEIKKYYANSVVIGNLVLISGQTPMDLNTARIEVDSFEEQMQVALQNLKKAVEETGSSLECILKTYILLPRSSDYANMRKIEQDFYRTYAPTLLENLPASTVIHPRNLASPKMLIEIEAICVIPENHN